VHNSVERVQGRGKGAVRLDIDLEQDPLQAVAAPAKTGGHQANER
jgi:hypothetical protein